ncbi:hypothetical protein [Luteibacter yeojuensis]
MDDGIEQTVIDEKISRCRTAQIQRAIREVLLKEWDPIGIQAFDEAKDEYDGYVPDVHHILMSGGQLDDLGDFLRWAEVTYMGLIASEAHTRRVAAALIDLRARMLSKDGDEV